MRPLAAALLLSVTVAPAASVTRFEFSRSGGQLPGQSVKGAVELHGDSGRVTAANGYVREFGPAEVVTLREALAQPPPPPALAPDAYTYSVRIERGRKVRSIVLSDVSPHLLVPWLQKETAAIARAGKLPANH